jgi:hypothetical protein
MTGRTDQDGQGGRTDRTEEGRQTDDGRAADGRRTETVG